VHAESLPPSGLHRPVLLDEVVRWVAPRPGAILVDGTVGAGGHAAALARHLGSTGRLIGLDRDPEMLALAEEATQGLPVTLVRSPHSAVDEVLTELGLGPVDGLLLDLGVSSDQLRRSQRGFSFTADGPLDMRYDPNDDVTAADLINTLSADELADLFFRYGEERHSRRIARTIVAARRVEPIMTTSRLAALVRKSIPGKWGRIDPATRVFQALRIRVNRELEHLEATLTKLTDILRPAGRVVIVSFHSLEDRKVKWAFRNDPNLAVLTRKPITASAEEVRQNPRARSAKLRAAERCPTNPPSSTVVMPRTSGPGLNP
jgi:16S rRNA (cytosine1402-N4)-methyltransferase